MCTFFAMDYFYTYTRGPKSERQDDLHQLYIYLIICEALWLKAASPLPSYFVLFGVIYLCLMDHV